MAQWRTRRIRARYRRKPDDDTAGLVRPASRVVDQRHARSQRYLLRKSQATASQQRE
jgi:hypothetical protein